MNSNYTYYGSSNRGRLVSNTIPTGFVTPSKVDLAKVELQIAQRKLDNALAAEKTTASKTSLFGSNDDYDVGAILVVTKTFGRGGGEYTYLLRKHSWLAWTHTARKSSMLSVCRFDDIVGYLTADCASLTVELVTQVEAQVVA